MLGSDEAIQQDADAQDFVRDAYGHLKAVFVDDAGLAFAQAQGCAVDDGLVQDIPAFIEAAKTRQWEREAKVRGGY